MCVGCGTAAVACGGDGLHDCVDDEYEYGGDEDEYE